jgi:hypothetical protein
MVGMVFVCFLLMLTVTTGNKVRRLHRVTTQPTHRQFRGTRFVSDTISFSISPLRQGKYIPHSHLRS